MSLTADVPYRTKGVGRIIPCMGIVGKKYYKGAICGINTNGLLDIPSAAGTLRPIFGVVAEYVDCTTVAKPVRLEVNRVWILYPSSAITNNGQYIFPTDDNTFTASSASTPNTGPAGQIVEWENFNGQLYALVDFNCCFNRSVLA